MIDLIGIELVAMTCTFRYRSLSSGNRTNVLICDCQIRSKPTSSIYLLRQVDLRDSALESPRSDAC